MWPLDANSLVAHSVRKERKINKITGSEVLAIVKQVELAKGLLQKGLSELSSRSTQYIVHTNGDYRIIGRYTYLHAKRQAHGKVESILTGYAILILYQTQTSTQIMKCTNLLDARVLFQEGFILELLEKDNAHEECTKNHIS